MQTYRTNGNGKNVLRFLQAQKDRVAQKVITGIMLCNYVKAIKFFCEMNDILIAWKKLLWDYQKEEN
jgi:hypothetical protein